MHDAIEQTLELEASPDAVWRALTDPAEISAWFCDETDLMPQVGNVAWFFWEAHGRYSVRVDEVEPQRRFVWSWVHQKGTPVGEAPATRVEWTLTPRPDGGTTLLVRESGFLTAEHRGENIKGWAHELGELVAYLAGS
jgi:uncharacterized protein YndB with AHSA1/START domain